MMKDRAVIIVAGSPYTCVSRTLSPGLVEAEPSLSPTPSTGNPGG